MVRGSLGGLARDEAKERGMVAAIIWAKDRQEYTVNVVPFSTHEKEGYS